MNLILVAQSARMLAQSAARAGLRCCSIDHFGDADTRRFAWQSLAIEPKVHDAPPDKDVTRHIPPDKGGLGGSLVQESNGFDEDELLKAADRLAPPGKETALIYGSGIDTRPDLVERLARGRNLLGNSPATLNQVNNPREFFSLLARLGIPHPETRFSPPARSDGWLVKPGCGEGGKGVGFFAEKRQWDEDVYYQRHVQGEALSVLFLANGKEASTIGFNTQWTSRHDPDQPFLFAGAVNRADISEAQRLRVEEFVSKLTEVAGLVGLISLDFIVQDGECLVLELNPRPSATMALYDEDFPLGLLSEHIAACRCEPPPCIQRIHPARALRIVYARRSIIVPVDFRWLCGCADIPNTGVMIRAGQPLCTLQAQGGSRSEAECLVNNRESQLLLALEQSSRAEQDSIHFGGKSQIIY